MVSNVELKMVWEATFIDGTKIKQFEGDKENLFSEVKKKFTLLESFKLVHKEKPLIVTVDLLRGLLFLGHGREEVETEFRKSKKNIRLIFFRRNKINFDEQMKETSHNVSYFIGFQYIEDGFR